MRRINGVHSHIHGSKPHLENFTHLVFGCNSSIEETFHPSHGKSPRVGGILKRRRGLRMRR
jgi:hypothetical protein